MQAIYPYVQIVHLFCAVFFVGYLFFDVIMLKIALKNVGSESGQKVKKAIGMVETKIMPLMVLVLILTGGMMMSSWVSSEMGYFSTNLQKIFMIKVLLGFIIFFMIATNLTFKFILKKSSPLGNIHPFALVASIIIILFAKLMFLL